MFISMLLSCNLFLQKLVIYVGAPSRSNKYHLLLIDPCNGIML